MYAVIQTGGKQYRVKSGDLLSIEKLGIEAGQKVQFDQVLLIEDEGRIQVGRPVLEKAVVEAVVVENFRDEKVLVFKKKRRKQFRRTRGHRQQLTKVRIDAILADKSVLPAVAPIKEKPAPAPKPAADKVQAAAGKPKRETQTKTPGKPAARKKAGATKTKKKSKE